MKPFFSMKRRSRAAVAGTPTATDALFMNSDGTKAEWAATVTAGTAVAARRTWSADVTIAKAAELAARSVRASASPTDDGKYAKYTAGGFVLVRADDGVDISNAGAVKGDNGDAGIAPLGARGTSTGGSQGSGTNPGQVGVSPQGRQGDTGVSPQGAVGDAGVIANGRLGDQGVAGSARGALASKALADASIASSSGLFAPRAADGSMPSLHVIATQAYDLSVAATLVSYGVASPATLSWTVHVLVGTVYVLVDQRSAQACPTATYREYTLAATPPACTGFRITLTSISGTSTALLSVLVVA